MATTAGRRTLRFARLEEVMPDVDRFAQGYTTVGHWKLGQICNHMTKTVNGSLDGFDTMAPWLLRTLVAPLVMKRVLKTESMPEGIRVPKEILPGADLDDRTEVEALRAALARFIAHQGPVAVHPFFDRITREQWDHIHRIHCAHHLSFAQPR
jgi:Protein of unknown function (DUF1569)